MYLQAMQMKNNPTFDGSDKLGKSWTLKNIYCASPSIVSIKVKWNQIAKKFDLIEIQISTNNIYVKFIDQIFEGWVYSLCKWKQMLIYINDLE